MVEPWVYAALTGIAFFAGAVDSVAGGGGLIVVPALLFAGLLRCKPSAPTSSSRCSGRRLRFGTTGAPGLSNGGQTG